MATLEELGAGALVEGLVPGAPVSILTVQGHEAGSAAARYQAGCSIRVDRQLIPDCANLPSVMLESVQSGRTANAVVAYMRGTVRTAAGFEVQRWITDWQLVQESGQWRLDVGIRRAGS